MIGLKVLTLGTFDLFHQGHVNLLLRCKEFAGDDGHVCVGVNSDRFVKEYKGQRPTCPEAVRLACVKAYGYPSLNDGPGEKLIRLLHPRLLVIGSDWAERNYFAQIGMTADDLFRAGVSLMYVPRTPGVSSSGLRR